MPFFLLGSKVGEVVITDEQLTELFNKHDVNGDRRLCKEELKQAFKDLGSKLPGYRASCGLRCADGNKDGFIDRNELENLVIYASKRGYTIK